jgi:4-hydroxy-tetrahydrodipicolinate synthase
MIETNTPIPAKLPRPLRGIIPPMVTPLEEQDVLDNEGLERLIEHILAGGVHGLFLLGTTGEAPSLSLSLRRALIQRASQLVAGRVPLLVGITDPAPAESIRLANFAASCGVDALVLAAPYYFPIGQSDLVEYFQYIIPKLPLPVFLYNMPSHTKISFSAETVRRALDMPRVIGLKDSSAGAKCFGEVRSFVLKQRPEFSLLIGPEDMLSETLPRGAHGGVCGGANLFPSLFTGLYEASIAGDSARVAELQKRVLALPRTIYDLGTPGYDTIRGLKAALAYMGICSDRLASPLQNLSDAERAHVHRWMAELSPRRDDAPLIAK